MTEEVHPAVDRAFKFLQALSPKFMTIVIDLYAARAERGDILAIENHRTLATMLEGKPVADKSILGLVTTILLEFGTEDPTLSETKG